MYVSVHNTFTVDIDIPQTFSDLVKLDLFVSQTKSYLFAFVWVITENRKKVLNTD